MATLLVNVKLKDGVDQNSFVSEFDSVSEVTVKDLLPNIPTLVIFNVEDSYLSTLQSHSSVEIAEEEPQSFPTVTYPSQPSAYTLSNKTVAYNIINASRDGTDYLSYQHYLDTDAMQKDGSDDLGIAGDYNAAASGSFPARAIFDENGQYASQTYSSRYTGKHVDIVALEVGPIESYAGYQDNHPDFDNPDNTGNTRVVPMNWNGCSSASNIQVTSNSMLTAHAIGTLSAAGGVYGGIAKKSNLYAIYTSDALATVCNAIIHFHNNKGTNGTTGLKNPTVVVGEFQYLRDTYKAIKVSDIASVTDATGGTTSRPGSGWGSDLTAFSSRNIFPYRVQDPTDDSWHWMVTFPQQSQFSSVKTAMDSLYDNGIILINAAGNNGGTFVKENDSRWNGTYCTIDTGGISVWTISYVTSGNAVSAPGTVYGEATGVNYYPFIAPGPHGLVKGIDVAAGQNSESQGMLDDYTNRGPGIDIVGRGSYTFTSYPTSTDTNGYKWGNFSGTSCATPTVVGKAACMMEEYYTLNGAWPNFTQVKNMLQTEARNGNNRVLDPASTTWSNVPAASSSTIQSSSQMFYPVDASLLKIPKDGGANGGFTFAELAGTPNFFAFWNERGYSREQTMHKRPSTGVMYPRPKNISNIE